jgi:hypothetical protein
MANSIAEMHVFAIEKAYTNEHYVFALVEMGVTLYTQTVIAKKLIGAPYAHDLVDRVNCFGLCRVSWVGLP